VAEPEIRDERRAAPTTREWVSPPPQTDIDSRDVAVMLAGRGMNLRDVALIVGRSRDWVEQVLRP
jgi:hypothetical protein